MSVQPKAHKKLARNIGLGIGLVITLLIILFLPMIPVTYEETEPRQRTETYWEKEPYQVKKTESKTLIDYKFTVPARDFVYYSVYIDVTGRENNLVTGTVIETAGYDINFYVFDQKGFNAWSRGGSAQAYVDARRVGSYTFSFVPDHSDYYYFVLDNKYSWFTNKVPYVTAEWSYQITVTEYRDVQKTRTITEYVKVTKTKYVSLFQLLTRTA